MLSALGLGTWLYLTPIAPIPEEPAEEEQSQADMPYVMQDDVTEIKNELDSATLATIGRLELAVQGEKEDERIFALDSLVSIYDMLRKPTGAVYHAKQRAEITNTSEHWVQAGERFLLNAKYMGDESRKKAWYTEARKAFEKAQELSPEDLDIQVDLAVAMIEGASFLGTPPMEGIGMLRNVNQLDPDNIKALINLGYFSVRSGQYEKAEERFLQVLEVDPDYPDVHLYLADLYEKKKEWPKAIEALKKYRSTIEDPKRLQEVNNYISQLKQNI